MLKTFFVLAVTMALVGCASVPMGDATQDVAFKTFTAKPGVAGIYVYRNENFGAALRMDVEIDGREIGKSAAKTYFYKEVAPGKHTITSRSENADTIEINAVAGKLYYIWQEVKMGMWTGRSQLHQTDERNGRAGVMESKLIAMSISENDVIPFDTPLATPAALQAPSNDSVSQKLRELQNLRKDGLISEEEFKKKKEQLLEKL